MKISVTTCNNLQDNLYMVFELLERGEVLEIPAEKPLSEEEAWWEFSIHLCIIFKHVRLFIFQSRLVSYNIILDRHEESPKQYSHYQEKLSRRPLGPGVLALSEDHPQRYQAKQPSQVFSSCWQLNCIKHIKMTTIGDGWRQHPHPTALLKMQTKFSESVKSTS